MTNKDDEFSIGHMAALHCLSEKALRLYQQKGLLYPARVDPSSGYRYYSYDQCSTIDMIQQLQTLGISLSEIKELIESKDPEYLREILQKHLESIEKDIARSLIAKQNALQLLEKEAIMRNPPLSDHVILEHLPERNVLLFDLPRSCSLDNDDVKSLFREWENNLGSMRKHLQEKGVPLSLFHQVGDLIKKEDLISRNLDITQYFIIIDDCALTQAPEYHTLPAGQYLTIYEDHFAELDGSNTELKAVRKMLDFAEEHQLEIVGDYLGEIVTETPIFAFEGRNVLMKLEIPVSYARK